MACTTLLVGKDASYDGSTIIARNEDCGASEFCLQRFAVVLPSEQPRHYRSVISHVEIDLPDNPMRYSSLPNALDNEGIWAAAGVNEANVAMSATETITTNPRVLAADPLVELKKAQGKEGDADYVPEVPGGIGEEDIPTLVLPYIHSAREGVQRLGELLATYGTYENNGIAFADVDEIWWLETIGGHHWIARRVPDDCYVTMPNQLGIDMFDLADAEDEQEDFMCSADLRTWMADNCLDRTINDAEWPFGRFNPREAFGSHADADHVYNTPRAWAMQRYLSPRAERWDGPNADYTPESDDLPWMREAERKLTVEDVKDVLSNHYQGTPYDPYGRWGDEATRHAYRPIAVNRNCQSHIIQLRGDMPAAVQAVEWVFFGSNVFNAPVALFANADAAPEYLANTTERVDTDNLYWASRLIGALADAQFSACANHIEHYQEAVAAQSHAIINRVRREVIAAEESYEQATARLTRANDEIAAMAKKETDTCLSNVLFATSLGMKNAFARNDR